jgi:epoxyqueuosine reductase
MAMNWRKTFEEHGFQDVGWVKVERPVSIDYYKTWIDSGYHAKMDYLPRHTPIKENPSQLLATVKTAFVVAADYVPHPHPNTIPTPTLIAKYAQGADYHEWLKSKLELCIVDLKKNFPEAEFVAFTDDKPILERDLAHKAGLGWFGKNSCLINQKRGSFFLIGEIYTSLDLPIESAVTVTAPDRCGSCTKCIEACPTQAILPQRTIDSNKCISYHTIESKSLLPNSLHEKFGGWYFGCDICQDVCPWNKKVLTISQPSSSVKGDNQASSHPPVTEVPPIESERDFLKWILTASDQEIKSRFIETAMSRAKPNAHRRNALVVAANKNYFSLEKSISHYVTHPDLSELAIWTLSKIKPAQNH